MIIRSYYKGLWSLQHQITKAACFKGVREATESQLFTDWYVETWQLLHQKGINPSNVPYTITQQMNDETFDERLGDTLFRVPFLEIHQEKVFNKFSRNWILPLVPQSQCWTANYLRFKPSPPAPLGASFKGFRN
jgi:hypothetical protein